MPNTEAASGSTHAVTEGEKVTYDTANHPARTDSPEYVKTRKWLMGTAGGCVICGGVVDLSHPADSPAQSKGMEDHHGGGIYVGDVLVGLNLFPLEWSEGFGADPDIVAARIAQLNLLLARLGLPEYPHAVHTVDDVMAWVDSQGNANVKLCAVHHRSTETQDSIDSRGYQGVGIHHIPGPVFWYQGTCLFDSFDMWGGSTGTLAVTPHPHGKPGEVQVLHVAATHPDKALYEDHRAHQEAGKVHVLAAHHPHARLAHAGHPKRAAA